MRFAALLLLAASMSAGAGDLTWKEANQRSAQALRAGDDKTGLRFARQSFELYAAQSERYSPDTHAQLLMNLVHAVEEEDGPLAALEELDAGAAVILTRSGSTPGVLASIYEQGLRKSLFTGGWRDLMNRYYAALVSTATGLWGASDARTITVIARWAPLMGRVNSESWIKGQLEDARQRAVTSNNEPLELALDVALARHGVEYSHYRPAIAAFEKAIGRLEPLTDDMSRATLFSAVHQLRFAYREVSNRDGEARMNARLNELRREPIQDLGPIFRAPIEYPKPARLADVQGYVVFQLSVSPAGSVEDATVIDSIPRGWFEAAALASVVKWKFAPRAEAWKGEQRIDFLVGRP